MELQTKIRKMTESDYPLVLDMTNRLHAMHVENRPDIYKAVSTSLTPEDFREIISDPLCIAVIAEWEGHTAGYGMAKLRKTAANPILVTHKTLYIDDIFVYPAFRHRHIGHEILLFFEYAGKRAGAERMDLTVWPFNESAVSFYKNHGMKEQRLILEKPLQ